MAYFLIVISMICLSGSFVLNKFFQNKISSDAYYTLLYSSIAQFLIALILLIISGFNLNLNWFGVGMAVISGFASLGYAVISVFAVKYGKIGIYSMFLMIGGMFLPYFFGIIFLKEEISAFKVIGMILLLGSLIGNSLMEAKKEENNTKTKPIFWILCIIAFILNGGSSIVVKIHGINEQALSTFNFLTLSAFFTSLIIAVAFSFVAIKNKRIEQNNANKKSLLEIILFSLGFALLSGGSSLCVIECAKTLPAVFEYPFQTGGTTILTSVVAWVIFKEKLDFKNIVCLSMMLVGTILFIF